MTKNRTYRSADTDLVVSIGDAVIREMGGIADDPDCETGGILIGRYISATEIQIETASTPPGDSEAGLDWFKRGERGLKELLETEWSKDPRRYYVGEWHFHPRGGGAASPLDYEQMREVATDARYKCVRPVMIILFGSRRRSVRVYVQATDGACVEFKE